MLIHLLKHDDTHGRMACWQPKLAEYDVEYTYLTGKNNTIADGLSRMPESYFKQIGKNHGGSEGDKIGKKKELGLMKGELVVELDKGLQWEPWKRMEWYGEVVTFKLRGHFRGRDSTAAGRRKVQMHVKRFLLFDGEKRMGLFYRELAGRMPLFVLPDDVDGVLTRYHNCHGYFASRLLLGFLIGQAYRLT